MVKINRIDGVRFQFIKRDYLIMFFSRELLFQIDTDSNSCIVRRDAVQKNKSSPNFLVGMCLTKLGSNGGRFRQLSR